MYGGSYNGFTQWAAAKHRPKALRALMPSVTVAPGIDVPMEGNVSLTFVYAWAPYVAEGKGLDDKRYGDSGTASTGAGTKAARATGRSMHWKASRIRSSSAGWTIPRTTATGGT
jgi:predicted acyl esterase